MIKLILLEINKLIEDGWRIEVDKRNLVIHKNHDPKFSWDTGCYRYSRERILEIWKRFIIWKNDLENK